MALFSIKNAMETQPSEKLAMGELSLLPPATKLRQGNIFTSMCQEFCPQGGGGHVWQGGACMAGKHAWWGECMVGVGGMCGGGMHGRGVCMGGGMHGRRVCMAGGVCGRGCAWQGVCMAGGHAWQEEWQLQWAVHILLECILVTH